MIAILTKKSKKINQHKIIEQISEFTKNKIN